MWLLVKKMPIKAGWWDSFLALLDSSRSNKHCIQLSTKNTIYISCFVIAISAFRSSRPELFCVKGVLKNFAEFTGVSSGTRVSCEFCEILKKTFLRKTPTVAASIEIPYTNTVCNKSAVEAWICLVSFYGGAKDFIFTCIFLRIIIVTGSKFKTWKTIIHLIAVSNNSKHMFIIYVIDLSTKNKMQRRGFTFLQKLKIQTFGKREKCNFQSFHFNNS